MPEGVSKDPAKDAEVIVVPAPKAMSKDGSPRHRPVGNIVKVRVELLDGSTMELDVGVSFMLFISKLAIRPGFDRL